jgi:UDPglucose 6-dehydrogenase
VTYDTPIDDQERADTEFVMSQVQRASSAIRPETMVLISSQLPVGSIRRLEEAVAASHDGRLLRAAYCPENLRLGSAIQNFLHPDRIVVGVRSERDKVVLQELLGSITPAIEWMSVESAEMTKHAINAFLATSVAFANEIASICESVGADAREVERGLKSEPRIGTHAPLAAGSAFSGGTLARDLGFLARTSRAHGIVTPLLASVLPSNDAHKRWWEERMSASFTDLSRTTVAVWGLSYKTGTDSLQRSLAVELCDWLLRAGAKVRVHDPLVRALPARWHGALTRCDNPEAALRGAHALIVATPSAEYRSVPIEQFVQEAEGLVILDADRNLPELVSTDPRLRYFAVGMPGRRT